MDVEKMQQKQEEDGPTETPQFPRVRFPIPKLEVPFPKLKLPTLKISSALDELFDPEQEARWMAVEAERRNAPLATRDAMLALLEETRKGAIRDRWILGFSAGSLFVGLAALLVALF